MALLAKGLNTTAWQSFILGLGLFFLGLRLVSEHCKSLAGERARDVLSRSTARWWTRLPLGLSLGALLQSATAVTFLGASLSLAGLLSSTAAASIILWSNVGLTLMAFVVSLPLHPLVALVVGGSGILLGTVRTWLWQTTAGILLGLGLILYGLQEMGAAAAPLQQAAWFQEILRWACSSPPLSFFCGFLAAALLQSNTGATLLIITLAGAGALQFPQAALLIYGTNLGAIPLRLVLSSGMRGAELRLVRWEDFFCLGSGILMMLLFYLEQAGIPLVLAGAGALGGMVQGHTEVALALVFFFSNLLPAVLYSLAQPWLWPLMEHLWPVRTVPGPGTPQFLHPQALEHPSAALDLLRRETARLLQHVEGSLQSNAAEGPPLGFVELAAAIEQFTLRLAACPSASDARVAELHRLRALLSGIRHLEEAARFLGARLHHTAILPEEIRRSWQEQAGQCLRAAAQALDAGAVFDRPARTKTTEATGAESILKLGQESSKHGPLLKEWKQRLEGLPTPQRHSPDAIALWEDARFFWWSFHRLMKLLGTPLPWKQTHPHAFPD